MRIKFDLVWSCASALCRKRALFTNNNIIKKDINMHIYCMDKDIEIETVKPRRLSTSKTCFPLFFCRYLRHHPNYRSHIEWLNYGKISPAINLIYCIPWRYTIKVSEMSSRAPERHMMYFKSCYFNRAAASGGASMKDKTCLLLPITPQKTCFPLVTKSAISLNRAQTWWRHTDPSQIKAQQQRGETKARHVRKDSAPFYR